MAHLFLSENIFFTTFNICLILLSHSYTCVCACGHVHIHIHRYHSEFVGVRGPSTGASTLCSESSGVQIGGSEAWWWASLLAEPAFWNIFYYICSLDLILLSFGTLVNCIVLLILYSRFHASTEISRDFLLLLLSCTFALGLSVLFNHRRILCCWVMIAWFVFGSIQ